MRRAHQVALWGHVNQLPARQVLASRRFADYGASIMLHDAPRWSAALTWTGNSGRCQRQRSSAWRHVRRALASRYASRDARRSGH